MRLGYLPEAPSGFGRLTVNEFLTFCGEARCLSQQALRLAIDRTCQRVNLGEVLGRPMAELSKGWRQRAWLAQAILHEPEVLVLDEPTSALSIGETRKVLTYARAARDRGLGVIFITHNLHHVFEIADRVTVLFHGQNAGSYAVADLNPESAARLVMEGLPIPGPGP